MNTDPPNECGGRYRPLLTSAVATRTYSIALRTGDLQVCAYGDRQKNKTIDIVPTQHKT